MLPVLLVLALAAPAGVPPAPVSRPAAEGTAPAFGPAWTRLVGEWSGEGGGKPGEGSGSASFRFDLGGRILVRRSVADYPAAEGRPATHHEDLLVLTPGTDPARASAVYFDNEGHVIRYDAAWSADGAVLTLVSSDGPGPRFRLTCLLPAPDTMTVSFEIAPPGGEFRRYVTGTSRRVAAR